MLSLARVPATIASEHAGPIVCRFQLSKYRRKSAPADHRCTSIKADSFSRNGRGSRQSDRQAPIPIPSPETMTSPSGDRLRSEYRHTMGNFRVGNIVRVSAHHKSNIGRYNRQSAFPIQVEFPVRMDGSLHNRWNKPFQSGSGSSPQATP